MKTVLTQLLQIPADTEEHPVVVKHFRRNFTANFFDVAIFFFGDGFAAAYTILPVFVSIFTDSPILIALVPAVTEAGWFLPQMFMAPFVERQPRLKSLVLKTGAFERMSYLFLALGAFFLPRMDSKIALVVILFLVVYKAFISGFVALPWQEIVAKVIPVSHRGRFYGWSMLFGKVLGIGGAALTGYYLSNLSFPENYGVTFLTGFIVLMMGLASFAMTIEPEKIVLPAQQTQVKKGHKARKILSQDTPFRNFVISRFLSYIGYMAFGLFAVYGINKFDLPTAYSATFTMVLIAGNILGYAVFGEVGDRIGNKFVFATSDVLMAIGLLIALFANSLAGLLVIFVLVGVAQSGAIIADMNMVMEFSHPQDRPTYMGVFKTFTGPGFLISPLIGGGLVEIFGYKTMFFVSFLILLAAFIVLVAFVPEPRNTKPNSELSTYENSEIRS
jgi:MFS family permease